MNRVCVSLAGRAAEIEVYGRTAGLNTGASSDLAHARYLVKTALRDFAMGDKLYVAIKPEECEALLQEQYSKTVALISGHRAQLDALTDLLAKEKSLDKTSLENFYTSHGI
jgi:ATP-dependent Zn protease